MGVFQENKQPIARYQTERTLFRQANKSKGKLWATCYRYWWGVTPFSGVVWSTVIGGNATV